MAYQCNNTWCTKLTSDGCLIPEVNSKCPFLKIKMLQNIERQTEIVRSCQNKYFKTRSHADLDASKREETILDNLIRKFHQPTDYIQERFAL